MNETATFEGPKQRDIEGPPVNNLICSKPFGAGCSFLDRSSGVHDKQVRIPLHIQSRRRPFA